MSKARPITGERIIYALYWPVRVWNGTAIAGEIAARLAGCRAKRKARKP